MDDKHIHFTVLSECACELTSPIHAQIDSKELVYRRVAQASTNKKHYIVYNVGFLKEKKTPGTRQSTHGYAEKIAIILGAWPATLKNHFQINCP